MSTGNQIKQSDFAALPAFPVYPDLRGKTALIMGVGQIGGPSSSSISTSTSTWGNGAATARMLAHNGVKIFGCDINAEAAMHTESRLKSEIPDCLIEVTTADVTNEVDVRNVVHQMVTDPRFGRIDILINNVGKTIPGDPASMSLMDFQSQLTLNLASIHNCVQAVLPKMIAQSPAGGAIVNNASITGMRYIGKPQIGYAAAKAGVLHYTRHLAAMYGGQGIRANCVAPGMIWTPFVDSISTSELEQEKHAYEMIMKVGAKAPMGKMGKSDDVANAIAFLCSEVAAGFVTGQEIVIDGGLCGSVPF